MFQIDLMSSTVHIDESVALGDCIETDIVSYGNTNQEEENRNERRKEGYASSYLSDSTDGNSESNDEGRGYRDDTSSRVRGEPRRKRKRCNQHTSVLGQSFIPQFRKVLLRGQRRIVREVITFNAITKNYTEEVERIRDSLQRKGTVYAIARHDEPSTHWHIVHACPWRYYCCRCYNPPGRKRTCRTNELSNATDADWNRIFEYLSSNGRFLQYISSGITSFSGLRGIQYIPDERLRGLSRWEEPMENCQEESEGCTVTDGNDDDQQRPGFSGEPNQKRSKPTIKARYEDLESMILRYACVPLQSVTSSNIWQASQFRFIDQTNLRFRDVLQSLRKRLSLWDYNSFIKLYTADPRECLWEAINTKFDDYYYDPYISFTILRDLLEYQFNDIAMNENLSLFETVKNFMQEVYDICEKKRPKVNTLELIGPAGSGKSYFADCITAFYLNVGHAKNWNRNENFPLQSCIFRRIILWNEAQIEQSAHDSVKLLLGGDPCPANIKYCDTQTISRTPIIITANTKYLPSTQPFNQRMIRYTWISAPQLKLENKKPHPLAYANLLSYYKIVNHDRIY